MDEYHKIQTVYKRNPDTNFRTLLIGEYAQPEFEYLAGNLWEFTEKVDGTNIRISYKAGMVVIGGKTANAQIPVFLANKLAELFDAGRLVEQFEGADFCLYGEGYGAKIQKGGGNYNPNGVDFVLFDVNVDGWWLKREDVAIVATQLKIDQVPNIGEGTLTDMVALVRTGFKSRWGDFAAEGIVARPKTELFARSGARIIAKIKTKDFD